MPILRWISLVAVSCSVAMGCQGAVDGSKGRVKPGPIGTSGPVDPNLPSGTPPPGAVVMRRLTRLEFDNSVRDVAKVKQLLGSTLPTEDYEPHFNNNGAALTFPTSMGDAVFTAAQTYGREVAANLAEHVACAAAKTPECADTFIREFGQKAWRRPLTVDEAARLRTVFDVGNSQTGFDLGIELVATSMFISAPFWFRVELGDNVPVAGKPNLVRPSSWEMASRLSYALWNSAPDAALQALAAQDGLKTPEAIKTQALLMLDDPQGRAREAVANFNAQWLRTERTKDINKDPNTFPTWATEVAPRLRTEMDRVLSHAAWDAPNGLQNLLTSNTSYMNAELASFYGVQGPTGTAFEPIQLDSATRSGILTRAGFLALEGFVQTSPTLRGAFIRRRFLCGEPPPPPDANVAATKPPPSATMTTRSQVEAHANVNPCKSCHRFIDPIGFGLEGYDAIGMYRTTENDKPIDQSGEVVGMASNGGEIPSDIGVFKGAVELGQKMAQSATVTNCFADFWFRFTNGRAPTTADDVTLQGLGELVRQSGGSYRELMVALTQSDAFLYRPASGS